MAPNYSILIWGSHIKYPIAGAGNKGVNVQLSLWAHPGLGSASMTPHGLCLALHHYSTSRHFSCCLWKCPEDRAVPWAPSKEPRARSVQRGTNKHCSRQAALLVSLGSEPRPAASLRSQAQPNQGGGWKGSLPYFAPSQHIPRTPALRGFTELAVCYTHLAVSLNTTFGKSYLP